MRWSFIIVLALAMIGLASASVSVYNSSLKDSYFYGETISGKVNLTISSENLDADIISSSGDKKSLIDFLDLNVADYDCNPLDCGNGYSSLSSALCGPMDPSGQKKWLGQGQALAGFYLERMDDF